jgi:uncharacterized protein YbbK (DUF523 family)/uncharacterized protein YbgA (DUF1722 family)
VRYDGGHRGEEFLSGRLSRFVEWIPICPEAEMGLGTPRPRIDLHETSGSELRMVQEGRDITSRMHDYARARLADPDLEAPLCGYVFKARSPSCGIRDARVLHEDGTESAAGSGLFARAFRDRHPSVPVFDETILADPYALEAAVCAFFTMHRWHRHRVDGGRSIQEFHRAHRVLLTGRDAQGVLELDRYGGARPDLAAAAASDVEDAALGYEIKMAEMLQRVPRRADHARALAALADEIESELPAGGRERREVQAVVRHLVSLYPTEVDLKQTLARIEEVLAIQLPRYRNIYFEPHPTKLSLYVGL